MTEVFLCEEGQLTAESRRALKRAGIVVTEVKDVSRCQFIRASEIVSADDLLWAVLEALNTKGTISSGEAQRGQLAANLLQVVNGRRQPPTSD